jgi:HD superfamily phosphohydrolase
MEPPHYASPYQDERIKSFTVPISGSVGLFGPEIDIVSTEEFQRLGGIRQLSTAYFVYRGASHTRRLMRNAV